MENLGIIDQPVPQKKKPQYAPLLRPQQRVELQEEIKSIDRQLGNPDTREMVDVGSQSRQKASLTSALKDQSPQAFASDDMDKAVKLELKLRDAITSDGMCTQEEMRKNPAGAVDKHMGWDKRNGENIAAWKNLRLRLGESGHDFGNGLDGNANEVANLEMYRPVGGAQELNMSSAQIEGKSFHMSDDVGRKTVFTQEDIEVIRNELPEIYPKLALLDETQRVVIKQQIEFARGPKIVENKFSFKQKFPLLAKNIKEATGTWPKNKLEAEELIAEHNL
jgi:hypothetical protein